MTDGENRGRQQAEAALRESESRFREMVDGLPLIVWMHDAAGEQELVNETFCEFFGVTREEMKGGRWQILMHPEDADAYREEFFACVRERRPFHHEVRVRRADGAWRWIESWARPRFTSEGEFRGYVGTSADITDRLDIEERLRQSVRRKDEFLAMLGHELRNPLAAIRGAADLLERTKPDEGRLQEVVAVLQRQSLQMSGLIDGLLDVARMARGAIRLDRRALDVTAVLSAVLQDYERKTNGLGVQLHHDLPRQPLWVLGDPLRLTQVFDNVLGNAAKFTPAPGRIDVLAQRHDGEARICVRDTGPGISPQLLPRVFEPFEQGAHDGVESTGLGLGLAVAKRLVDLHGGVIEVRSSGESRGAEVEIRLPLSEAAEATPHRSREEDRAPEPKRILLVEDDADAGFTMRELLESVGHEVLFANDAPSGLDLARARRPDLVLCDVGLPGMSGYEFARRMRADALLRGVALAALTGFGRPEDRARALEAGFDEHLTKPADIEAVQAVVRRLTLSG